jgi:long-chain acyl-CoA synthetase
MVRTIAELPFVAAARFGDRVAFRFTAAGPWQERSFSEVAGTVERLAAGFVDAGVGPGDRVCLLAETRPEWTYASLALSAAGAVVVPIYPSSSAQECAWVAGNSGATMIVCENAAQLDKIDQVRGQLPALATTVLIDPGVPGQLTLAELLERGQTAGADGAGQVLRRRERIGAGDPCLIIYTSGTTGPPKGCVLTHHNWLTLCNLIQELETVTSADAVYLFLPLAHVFAQIVQFGCLYSGATLIYYGGDPRRLVTELAETRPTFLPAVPRVFEKLYTLVTGRLDPDVVDRAVRVGLEVRQLRRDGRAVPPELEEAFRQADALFAPVRAAFGGRLRQALSGAAPISPQVLRFFHAAGVPVLEGYGMSETTGLGTVSTLDHFRIGSVGAAAPGCEVWIGDDDEVLMRGPHVFAGYWEDPEATQAAVDEQGWVHTGDLGELDADGFLRITGRKKDIIVTAGGKNITPANLENELRQSRWLSHAVMYGDRQPYPVALLTLDEEEIVPWARERGLPADLSELASHPEVRALVQGIVDDVNARYARAEQIKRFAVLDRDLSQDAGEITPTLKVKRNVVYANHAHLVDALYA